MPPRHLQAHFSREFVCLPQITNKLWTAVPVVYDTQDKNRNRYFHIKSFTGLKTVAVSHRSGRHLNTFIVVQLLSAITNHCWHGPLIGQCDTILAAHWLKTVDTGLWLADVVMTNCLTCHFLSGWVRNDLAITDKVNIERADWSSCNVGKLEPRGWALTANQRPAFQLLTNQSTAYSSSNALRRPGEFGPDRVITSHLLYMMGCLRLAIGRFLSIMTSYWSCFPH